MAKDLFGGPFTTESTEWNGITRNESKNKKLFVVAAEQIHSVVFR
jgi:hypothetical protein